MLFTAAIVFGPRKGAVSGAFGMALFDALSEYAAWAPFTFVVRGIMGYIIGKTANMNNKSGRNWAYNLLGIFLGGIWMIYAEKKFRNNNPGEQRLNVTAKQALVIGLFQCLAIIPGMSRSASTIIGGWVSGLTTVAAAEFSFFLAIPVMVGMSFLEILKTGGLSSFTPNEIISLAVGFIVSFIVALMVIKGFISYLKRKPMKVFAVYRMIFAVLVLLAGFFGIFG
jgi:undecaprenyl-diphosphatase UppP